jgi:hypothetical protein
MKLSEIIRRTIELGHRKGFVTFDQLNELLPAATTAPEEIEIVIEALSDEGINVVDSDDA